MNDHASDPSPESSTPSPGSAPGSSLSFWMGKYEATFPTDRLYAKNHMWAQAMAADGEADTVSLSPDPRPPIATFRFGFSAYAVRLLQDVYFLDWHVDAPAALAERQEIGEIESSKAESALYAPIAGTLAAINADLLADPSTINVDNYRRGWLFEIAGPSDGLLTAEAYLVHLESAWKLAERTIKGQMNE